MKQKKRSKLKKSASDYRKLNEIIEKIEGALDRKLKVEKAMIGICLRYQSVNLKNVVKCLLEGEYPIVEGMELHHDLAKALGVALEEYSDEAARKVDVDYLIKKWSMKQRRKALASYKYLSTT